jgi:hypothetical protein
MPDCNCRINGLPCECPKPGRPPSRPCGTLSARKRHYRHKEKPCRACKQAWSRWWQATGRAQRQAREQRKQAAA